MEFYFYLKKEKIWILFTESSNDFDLIRFSSCAINGVKFKKLRSSSLKNRLKNRWLSLWGRPRLVTWLYYLNPEPKRLKQTASNKWSFQGMVIAFLEDSRNDRDHNFGIESRSRRCSTRLAGETLNFNLNSNFSSRTGKSFGEGVEGNGRGGANFAVNWFNAWKYFQWPQGSAGEILRKFCSLRIEIPWKLKSRIITRNINYRLSSLTTKINIIFLGYK